jgi:hypothetical protein
MSPPKKIGGKGEPNIDCLRPVSCVPNATGVSGLFILDCPFGFSNVYLLQHHLTLSDIPFLICFCL